MRYVTYLLLLAVIGCAKTVMTKEPGGYAAIPIMVPKGAEGTTTPTEEVTEEPRPKKLKPKSELAKFLEDPNNATALTQVYPLGRSCFFGRHPVKHLGLSGNLADCDKYYGSPVVQKIFELYKKAGDCGRILLFHFTRDVCSKMNDRFCTDIHGSLHFSSEDDSLNFRAIGWPRKHHPRERPECNDHLELGTLFQQLK